MYDVIICGSGPAGMSAAIYLKRANLNIVLIEKSIPGGKIVNTTLIENYPGYIENNGVDLAMNMYRQMKHYDIPYIYDEVVKIEKLKENHFVVNTLSSKYEAKFVIFGAGTVARSLNAKNEQEFIGRGISYCAVCDGAFHSNQEVMVAGGGNSAVEEAIYLSRICKHLTVVTRNSFRADESLMNKVTSIENIDLLEHYEVISFEGKDLLERAIIREKTTKEEKVINITGAFIYVGFIPSSKMLENFNVLNDEKYVIVNENMETCEKGLYSVGDCNVKPVRQIVTAVSDGVTCAYDIIKNI